jgi:hypothetical protein
VWSSPKSYQQAGLSFMVDILRWFKFALSS